MENNGFRQEPSTYKEIKIKPTNGIMVRTFYFKSIVLLKMTDSWVEKLVKPRKQNIFALKKLCTKKKSSLISAQKSKYPARLDSAWEFSAQTMISIYLSSL